MTDAMVVLDGVSKTYRAGAVVHAVQNVDLEVREGELVVLQGPSGSGKSTLLGLLGLLDTPSAGAVRIEGVETATMGDRARTRLRSRLMGFVFQQFNLIGSLTAATNVETALLYRGLSRARRRRLANEALDRVGLGHRIHHRPAELSGGEQQRVSLARAVATEPRIIMADEPTGNLDSHSTATVLDILDSFVADGVAVVVATHDPMVAERAHRRLVMRDGRLSDGT